MEIVNNTEIIGGKWVLFKYFEVIYIKINGLKIYS